ncbi:hypothetical protein B484DRAFT_333713, partial [Ochromonadaceae sp. CCMP2298]
MGNSAEVKEVLTDILAARDAGKQYDPHGRERKRGRKPLIVDGTPQAQVAYTALGAGLSTTQTAVLVNEWRAAQLPVPLPSLSWSAVEAFVLRSDVIDRSRRVTKKSGKADL